MQPKNVAFRKRNQIAKANRTMFIWVACVSVVFGVALVVIIFLTRILLYNERVIAAKNQTISTLAMDNKNVKTLESQIRVLNTNQALIDSKAKADDQAIQAILDALPSDANSLALGASLQNKLLSGIPGLVIDSLQVDPVAGIESLGDAAVVAGAPIVSASSEYIISFRFSVEGSDVALKSVLQNLEKSIRTIDIVSLTIASQGTSQVLNVEALAYYEPARVVQLKDVTVK